MVQAHSPLGQGRAELLQHEVVLRVASQTGLLPPQVVPSHLPLASLLYPSSPRPSRSVPFPSLPLPFPFASLSFAFSSLVPPFNCPISLSSRPLLFLSTLHPTDV